MTSLPCRSFHWRWCHAPLWDALPGNCFRNLGGLYPCRSLLVWRWLLWGFVLSYTQGDQGIPRLASWEAFMEASKKKLFGCISFCLPNTRFRKHGLHTRSNKSFSECRSDVRPCATQWWRLDLWNFQRRSTGDRHLNEGKRWVMRLFLCCCVSRLTVFKRQWNRNVDRASTTQSSKTAPNCLADCQDSIILKTVRHVQNNVHDDDFCHHICSDNHPAYSGCMPYSTNVYFIRIHSREP